MEFFEYLRIPQYIMQFMRNGSGGISLDELYIMFCVAGGAYLICLILGGLALYVMAERADVKHSWLGFIPFANTYYAGKVAGEVTFFGKKMKRAGLYAMIAEIVYAALEILSLVSSVLLSDPAFYETSYIEGNATLIFNIQSVPSGMRWLAGASNWFAILALVADLVMIVFLCAVYNGLYRKYSPRNAYIMTVFSVILPIRAFFMFAVRNNTPVDYNEYMKKRIEQAMRSAGVYVNEKKPEEPFSDFKQKSSPSSPFSEFDDNPPPAESADPQSESSRPNDESDQE